MLSRREKHCAVSISNKMFMIGGCSNSCEVFDSVTRKFTYIEFLPDWVNYLNRSQIVSFGYNIYFFVGDESTEVKVYSFDVKNCDITHQTSLSLENTKSFICTKVSVC